MTGCWARQDEGGLPHCCHVVLPGLPAGGNVAVCVRRCAWGAHDEYRPGGLAGSNDSLGIDAAAEHAMLAGCLRGWDSELADPDFLRATDRRFMATRRHGESVPVLH